MTIARSKRRKQLAVAAAAAFCTYFCMYAFRKPFTAGTFEGQEVFGLGLKTVLVVSQLLGYMLSKFIGIKVISEMDAKYRAAAIVGLIGSAELALVGFAFLPTPFRVLMMFLNGLPLGMVFGLVLAYLEGRQQTEALSAALCASFIMSSGVVKSVGRWLVQDVGVSEFQMPMLTGLLFLPATLLSVWVLRATPPPDEDDVRLRTERKAMTSTDRRRFLTEYWPGLVLLVLVYVILTVVRTVRDDFGVEIWRDMGVSETPSVFARSETLVALLVTAMCGLTIWIRHNLNAIRLTVAMMCGSFGLIAAAAILQPTGTISPFAFMVACGVGLYVPYVAFHTTIFERLIASARVPGNLGFLMYLADAIGYLGYAVVMLMRTSVKETELVLPFFLGGLLLGAGGCIVALLAALAYFHRALAVEPTPGAGVADEEPPAVAAGDLVPAE